MLAKNNHSEQIKRQMPTRQRFALRKLTVGVASVLIGFTYLGINQVAHADTLPTTQAAQNTGTPGPATSDHQEPPVGSAAPVGSSSSAQPAGQVKPDQPTNNQAGQATPTPTNEPSADSQAPAATPLADQYDVTYPPVGAADWMGMGLSVPVKPSIPAGVPGTIQFSPVTAAEATPDHPATPDWITVSSAGEITIGGDVPIDLSAGEHSYSVKVRFTVDGSTKIISGIVYRYPDIYGSSYYPGSSPYPSKPTPEAPTVRLHYTTDSSLPVDANQLVPSITFVFGSYPDGIERDYYETYNRQIDAAGEVTYVGSKNGIVLHGITASWCPAGTPMGAQVSQGAPQTEVGADGNTATRYQDAYSGLSLNVNGVYFIDPRSGEQVMSVPAVPGRDHLLVERFDPMINRTYNYPGGIMIAGATAKPNLTATVGEAVPTDPRSYLNLGDLMTRPDNYQGWTVTDVTWETKPGQNGKFTTTGLSQGTVKISFSDGTYLNVPVTINVQAQNSEATTNQPVGQELTTTVGVAPQAKDGIKNAADLPQDATYTWQGQPDLSTPGDVPGTVVVTYGG